MKPISIKAFAEELAEFSSVNNACPDFTRQVLGDFCTALTWLLSEGKAVNLPGVGTLYPATRAARRKKCGLTGEVLDWPEVKTVKFRASKVIKRELNKETK